MHRRWLLRGVWFFSRPRPGADLPSALFVVKNERHLSLFDHRRAVLLIDVGRGKDDIGDIAFDLGAGGDAIFHDAIRDSAGLRVFVVV